MPHLSLLVLAISGTFGDPVAGNFPLLAGNHLLFRASEADQSIDWNADGDQEDHLLFVRDLETGTESVLPLPILAGELLHSGNRVFFRVSEPDSSDWNADGDTSDAVLHSIDLATLAVENHGIAAEDVYVSAGLVAARVNENAQGSTDLNGDGDALDETFFVGQSSSGELEPVGYAVQPNMPLELGSRYAASTTNEQLQGADLNGDGDQEDGFVFLVDALTGVASIPPLPEATSPRLDEPYLWLSVMESDLGGDITGDGDEFDLIQHVLFLEDGALLSLGASGTVQGRYGPHFMVSLRENATVGDLNGDGDLGDPVLQAFTLGSGGIVNVGLSHTFFTEFSGPRTFFSTAENQQAADLDGNGVIDGSVLSVHNFADGKTTTLSNLRTIAPAAIVGEGGEVFFLQDEAKALQDSNGDGDMSDFILHWVDRSNTVHNLGIHTNGFNLGNASAVNGLLAIAAAEFPNGTDLNSDGDSSDNIVQLVDFSSGEVVNTGLAGNALVSNGTVVVTVVQETVDLNGDGDAEDLVVVVSPSPF